MSDLGVELNGVVSRWRQSLAAGDPAVLGLAPDARYTENGRELALGEGLWASATGIPEHDYIVVQDPELGQTCWFGPVDEGERAAVVFARLGVRDDLVHEIEIVVRREHPRLYAPQNMLDPRPIVFEELEPEARSSRERLVEIANLYFDGLEQVDGELFPAEPECVRLENGQQTVRVADVTPFAGTPSALIFPMGVQQQISSGYFSYIGAVRDGRVAAIDETRGLVVLIVVFDHSATKKTVQVKGIGELPVAAYHQEPNSVVIAELFKVRSGRIAHIEAILEFTPYGTRTGWEEE